MPTGPVVHTCDEHASVYYHLLKRPERGLALTHLDAHCDLRGTLIDVRAGRAWMRRSDLPLSPSTYLSHLVAQGIVTDVEWVHDEVGGRANDLFTVLYTSDLDKPAYRLIRKPSGAGVPLAYRESSFSGWRHEDALRVLDVDWDFFADWRKTDERASREAAELLASKIAIPPHLTYVAYSSQYSRPSKTAYDTFVRDLARALSAPVTPIDEAPIPKAGSTARALPPVLRRALRGTVLALKRAVVR